MRIRLRGLLVAAFLAAAVAVNAQQPQTETIDDLTSAVQKLEAVALNPAIRPEVREVNRGFLISKRAKLLALLLEKKQARSEYLSASISSLGTDQIVKVEEEISDLNAKIKTLQAPLPDEQSASTGTGSFKTETSSPPSSPGESSSDPPANDPGKTASIAPDPTTGTPQASSSTEPEKTRPTTVRSQYELRLAGTAADLRAAKASNSKATLNLQSNFYLFALALIAPKVEETQPAAIADFTAKAENIKTDKQTGSGQGSGGTTSLVTKASIPAVFGFAVENGALGAYVLSRALALNGMRAKDVKVVPLESNEQPGAFAKGQVDAAVTFDPYRDQLLRAGARTLFDSTEIPGEIVDLVAVRAGVLDKQPKAVQALLRGWLVAIAYLNRQPVDAARRMGIRQQTTGEQFLKALKGLHIPSREENLRMLGGAKPELATSGRRLMALMLEAKLLRAPLEIESLLAPGPLATLPP